VERSVIDDSLTGSAGVSRPAFELQEDILNIHCDTHKSICFSFFDKRDNSVRPFSPET